MLKLLVTMPVRGTVFPTFWNESLISEISAVGNVVWNESDAQLSHEELCRMIEGVDIVVSGWGTPDFDNEVLLHADRLKLIAHTGGSVKPYVTDACYDKGIRVVSGNAVFAESVAESVIAYALASLRDIPRFSSELKSGSWPDQFYNRGLLDRRVGIVGYGMIARYVVGMLQPFHCPINVFSRHIRQEELDSFHMEKKTLEELFSECDIISIHSGMTKENYHLVTEELMRLMKPGALLINTARGAVIDEPALCRVLKERNIYAVLDVYETEPLPSNHELLLCENAILMPHMGGPTIDRRFAVTKSIIADIGKFLAGDDMSCEIDRAYAAKMSVY